MLACQQTCLALSGQQKAFFDLDVDSLVVFQSRVGIDPPTRDTCSMVG